MAVDANVLIYERIQEEIFAGKGVNWRQRGFKSVSAIIDGNVTTLFAGIILYFFGSGPIKGFAATLIIGIFTSLFTSILLPLIFEWQMKHNIKLTFTSKLTVIAAYTNIKFIEIRKYAYIVSDFYCNLCFQSPSADSIWVSFGGRTYTVRFDKEVRVSMFRNLWLLFGITPEVKLLDQQTGAYNNET